MRNFTITPAELLGAVVESREGGRVSPQLAILFGRLVEGVSAKPNFLKCVDEYDLEDMRLSTMEDLVKAYDKPDLHKPGLNLHAYFSTVVFNNFKRAIVAKKKYEQGLHDYDVLQHLGMVDL